jgi:hypothetical protein
MKVLLDECCPRPIKKHLHEFEVATIEMAGLKGLQNGALLLAADGKFDVLITADKNLRYEQNLRNRQIAIIELPFNSWRRIQKLLPNLAAPLSRIRPGEYILIQFESNNPEGV